MKYQIEWWSLPDDREYGEEPELVRHATFAAKKHAGEYAVEGMSKGFQTRLTMVGPTDAQIGGK